LVLFRGILDIDIELVLLVNIELVFSLFLDSIFE